MDVKNFTSELDLSSARAANKQMLRILFVFVMQSPRPNAVVDVGFGLRFWTLALHFGLGVFRILEEAKLSNQDAWEGNLASTEFTLINFAGVRTGDACSCVNSRNALCAPNV